MLMKDAAMHYIHTDPLAQRTHCAIILTLFLISISIAQDATTDKEAIEKAIHASIAWAKNKDFKTLYGVIANDSGYLEVDPDSVLIRGFDQFKNNEAFWGSPNFKAIRYEIRDLTISLSRTGEVSWFYCMLDDINEWKGRPASWLNTRWTGVLEKRNGRWVIVQMHFSFASDR
jgi:ketosteroid isomerase-like protein